MEKGTKVKVIGNISHHGFKIGEIVMCVSGLKFGEIVEHADSTFNYKYSYFVNNYGTRFWMKKEDYEIIDEGNDQRDKQIEDIFGV